MSAKSSRFFDVLNVPSANVFGGGDFVEKDHGKRFYYVLSPDTKHYPFPDSWRDKFPDVMQIGNRTGELRACKILKTVVHVVVDENPDCLPFVEKWQIKKNNMWKNR